MSEESLPEGWVNARFEEILIDPKADLVDGPFGSNLKSEEYVESGVPVLKIQNIKVDRFVRRSFSYVTQAKSASLARHSYFPGDLMITKLGDPLGLCCEVPKDFPPGIFVADLMRLRIRTDEVSKRFVLLAINSQVVQAQFKEITKGTTRPRVNLTIVRSLEIPLPPLAEQKRIVAKIEELFSELDAGEQSLRRARRQLGVYRQSLLKQAFEGKLTAKWREQHPDLLLPPAESSLTPSALPKTWRSLSLGESFKMYQPRTIATKEMVDGGMYLVYGANGIIGAYDQYNHEEPQVLVTCRGATCGAVNVSKPFSWINGNAMVIQPSKHPVDQRFLKYLFLGGIKVNEAISGSAQPQITRKSLEPLRFPLCSLPEQQEIVRLLDAQFSAIEQTEREIDAALKRSEALRQSILKRAFTGQLVPPACRQAGKTPEEFPQPRPGKWWVYVLKCNDGSFYKGFTDNLPQRWKRHLAGNGAKWTKQHPPLELYYWEEHWSEESAVERERFLKSGSGREWFQREIVENGAAHEPASTLLARIRAERGANAAKPARKRVPTKTRP